MRSMPSLYPLSAMVIGAAAFWSLPAHAAWPDDVSLEALADDPGSTQDSRNAYSTVVRELGVAIANPSMGAARTSGMNGFDIQLVNSLAFIDARSGRASDPAPWQRVREDGDASRTMWLPGVNVRKGLPLGLEVGGRFSYVGMSRQTVVGGYGRWGLVEGYRQAPDIVVQIGYSAYVGNDQIDLGVMDCSGSIGYTAPFGRKAGLNEGTFSPFVGGGVYVIDASPRFSPAEQEELGVRSVSGFQGSDAFTEGYVPAAAHVGYRLQSGPFQLQMTGAWAPNALPMLNTAVGYVY